MRVREVTRLFFGSVAVYVIVAACSASDGTPFNVLFGSGGMLVDGASGLDPVPDARADVATSGTRLKARWIVGADGSRQFFGWYDSQRNHECDFRKATDGVMRCLPNHYATTGYYGDAGCTQPLAYLGPSGDCGEAYAAIWSSDGCEYRWTIYRLGAAATQSILYVINSSGSCVQAATPADIRFFEIQLIEPSEFVGATVETDS